MIHFAAKIFRRTSCSVLTAGYLTMTEKPVNKQLKQDWFVYIIEGTDGNFYTGITTDVVRRWGEHSGSKGSAKVGAKYFRGRKPKLLVYVEEEHHRSSATKREAEIKKLTRSEKIKLLSSINNKAKTHNIKLNQP